MLQLKPQQSIGCALILLGVNLIMLRPSSAEQSTVQGPSINNLYDNLLHREYAGPIVFPNHQVERKAQRSPSLRLRFGRSDPEMLSNIVEKRWFGDVNQKPIRSPSLRLRFGRRSDPDLPQMRRTTSEDLLERELTLNTQPANNLVDGYETAESGDKDVASGRVVRKPQRFMGIGNNFLENNQQQRAFLEREWLKWLEMTRTLLVLQQQYDNSATKHFTFPEENIEVKRNANNSEYPFLRKARKPMRLRWGRSTGKSSAEEKMTLPAETLPATPKPRN